MVAGGLDVLEEDAPLLTELPEEPDALAGAGLEFRWYVRTVSPEWPEARLLSTLERPLSMLFEPSRVGSFLTRSDDFLSGALPLITSRSGLSRVCGAR